MTFAVLIMGSIAVATILVAFLVVGIWRSAQKNARRQGYESLGAYLKSPARSDEEKRDAVNLALKGLVLCITGLIFPPLLLIGVFPLFYGARKVAWSSMGLGLVDDGETPSA